MRCSCRQLLRGDEVAGSVRSIGRSARAIAGSAVLGASLVLTACAGSTPDPLPRIGSGRTLDASGEGCGRRHGIRRTGFAGRRGPHSSGTRSARAGADVGAGPRRGARIRPLGGAARSIVETGSDRRPRLAASRGSAGLPRRPVGARGDRAHHRHPLVQGRGRRRDDARELERSSRIIGSAVGSGAGIGIGSGRGKERAGDAGDFRIARGGGMGFGGRRTVARRRGAAPADTVERRCRCQRMGVQRADRSTGRSHRRRPESFRRGAIGRRAASRRRQNARHVGCCEMVVS